jgi:hypothetical protein
MSSLFSGDDQADAQIKAAERSAAAQRDATSKALAAQEAAIGRSREILRPFSDLASSGADAFNIVGALTGALGPEAQREAFGNLQESPGQEFLREEGLKNIDQQAALSGNLGGGSRLKELIRFNQGLANQNLQQTLANLTGFGNIGLGTAKTAAGLEQGLGNVQATAADRVGQVDANRFLQRGNIQAGERAAASKAITDAIIGGTTALTGNPTGLLGALSGL